MTGRFVALRNTGSGNTIILEADNNQQTVYHLAEHVVVTINGMAAELVDLEPGDNVTLLGDPVVTISAVG